LAFSCKRRHFCPSCHQKRVKGSSLRLTHILPFCKEGLCPDR
jgi:hypothetical protein